MTGQTKSLIGILMDSLSIRRCDDEWYLNHTELALLKKALTAYEEKLTSSLIKKLEDAYEGLKSRDSANETEYQNGRRHGVYIALEIARLHYGVKDV